jgi:site-specific DNA-methyltransferase (adenine-specific)
MKEYFLSRNFTLYNGDCIEILKEIPANSIDMIFADPPYFLSSGSFTCHSGKRVSVKKGDWDLGNGTLKNLEFHIEWLKACKKVLKPNGTIWVSGTYHSIYQCGVALEINGYHLLNDITWFKPNAAPNLSCRFFTASHETLIWARKEKKGIHTFNYDLMKNGQWKEDPLKKDGLQMRSVWAIGTPKPSEKIFGKHPTQKPLDLLKRIILASTKKGDTILDPFAGSSTTGIAAVLNDRKFIGIDTEKKYLDLSVKRYGSLSLNFVKSVPIEYIDNYSPKQQCFLEERKKYNANDGKLKILTKIEATTNLKKYIGKDLRKLALKHKITTFETGKQNKGWKGLVLERLAGLKANVSKAPNGLNFELKSVSCYSKKDNLVPKETMAITMINRQGLLETDFYNSHCWGKLKSIILCAVMWNGKNATDTKLLKVISFDFTKDGELIKEIKADYDLIRKKLKTKGFSSLTGKDGKWIQARTKGSGHGSTTRAFYARKSLVKKILENSI